MFYQQGKLFTNWGKYLPIRKIIVWWPRAFLRSKSKVAQRPQIRPPRLFWPKIETFWFYWFWRNGKSRFLARHFWWFSKTVRKGSYKRLVFFLWKRELKRDRAGDSIKTDSKAKHKRCPKTLLGYFLYVPEEIHKRRILSHFLLDYPTTQILNPSLHFFLKKTWWCSIHKIHLIFDVF